MQVQPVIPLTGQEGERGTGKFYAELLDGLIAFAENEFALNARQDDGCTLRIHLQSLWRQSGEMPPELEPVTCPDAIAHVWDWWLQLSRARRSGSVGADPIGYVDIDAWARLSRIDISPFEIRALIAVDRLFLNSMKEPDD